MMKLCRWLTTTLAVVTLSLVALRAAEQTWVGEISDSACAMKHESGVENVPPPPANECVANCIRGGSKYVIVAGADQAVPLSYGPDPATGLSYNCDPSSADVHFSDVRAGDWYCRHAEFLRATGVITGYPDGSFQPAQDITRGQMAKFLANGFRLQLFGK